MVWGNSQDVVGVSNRTVFVRVLEGLCVMGVRAVSAIHGGGGGTPSAAWGVTGEAHAWGATAFGCGSEGW